jgi:hypothetical protein
LGLKALLGSPTAHFVFTAVLNLDEQRIFVESVIKFVMDIEDAKLRKAFWLGIMEDVLAKKPFAKWLSLILLESGGTNF